ncbi:MAG TPA: hypothetical protein VJH68_05090 [Candidatus Nanoarchaeia archaeon]|nr:hypothetical protein [Candidatus Nanoarchaeia archaeon]
MDELYQSLEQQIRWVLILVKSVLPQLSKEVENIIANRVNDEARIERTLDQLLDFSMLGIGEEQFKQLNEYYFGLNETAAKFYQNGYDQLSNTIDYAKNA